MTRDTKERLRLAARRAANCAKHAHLYDAIDGCHSKNRHREVRRYLHLLKGIERVSVSEGLMDAAVGAMVAQARGVA